MSDNSVTINLTPWMVLWSVVFMTTALIAHDMMWFWWALAPWIIVYGLAVTVVAILVPAALVTVFKVRARKR